MTATAAARPRATTSGPGLAATIAIGFIASAAVFGLLISGTVFLALAVAFETAIPIAQHYRVSVSAADMAMAAKLAELWWIPGIIAIASFLGAVLVGVGAVRHLGRTRAM
jgi:hypothetical protein